jgi:hypothetical protein
VHKVADTEDWLAVVLPNGTFVYRFNIGLEHTLRHCELFVLYFKCRLFAIKIGTLELICNSET